MNRKIYYLFLLFLMMSCATSSYVLENRTQTTGLDFTKGKWLLNEIDVPYSLSYELNKQIFTDFEKNLGSRLVRLSDTKGVIVPYKMGFYPNKETLKNLKIGANDFDYFINVKAEIKKNQFGEIDITPQKLNHGGKKQSEVTIEIYDLNLLQIVYSQKAIGSVNLPQNNGDVKLSNSVYNLIRGGYKRLIKDINNKSIIE
ncbi:hypothetical protein [Flavobacterium sp.]|uniref:hypothetical protein n=1 Tax=Flavobacterium sp. TaxID=239 RepID=UPI0037529684